MKTKACVADIDIDQRRGTVEAPFHLPLFSLTITITITMNFYFYLGFKSYKAYMENYYNEIGAFYHLHPDDEPVAKSEVKPTPPEMSQVITSPQIVLSIRLSQIYKTATLVSNDKHLPTRISGPFHLLESDTSRSLVVHSQIS